jgi:hypothetical protein
VAEALDLDQLRQSVRPAAALPSRKSREWLRESAKDG